MVYLFTESYPYGHGEQFLEIEVDCLASRFSFVVLIPDRASGEARPVPHGVTVDSSLARLRHGGARRVLRAGLSSVRSPFFYKELIARPWMALHWKALKRIVACVGDAVRVRNWLLRRVREGSINPKTSIFYTYWLGPQTLGIGLAKTRHPELILVSRAHRFDLYEERHVPPYLPMRRTLLGMVDRVFAVSEHGYEYLCAKYPAVASSCGLSRLGVPDPGFCAAPSDDGVLRIVSCSYLVPVKRVGHLVAALRDLASLEPSLRVEWHHFGDGPERSKVESSARTMLASTVRWCLHGQVPHHEIIDFYRQRPVDVFVNVSQSEGVPVSIMEALSCGIPVIATAVGGTPEIVNVYNGILVDEDADGKTVARALLEIAKGGRVAQGRRMASKKTWEDSCHAERNYDAFVRRLLTIRPGEDRKLGERV